MQKNNLNNGKVNYYFNKIKRKEHGYLYFLKRNTVFGFNQLL